MKVTKKHNNNLTNFSILKTGDVFLYCNNHWYIKTECHILKSGSRINAVDIENGVFSLFSGEAEVKKVEAEMIVEV